MSEDHDAAFVTGLVDGDVYRRFQVVCLPGAFLLFVRMSKIHLLGQMITDVASRMPSLPPLTRNAVGKWINWNYKISHASLKDRSQGNQGTCGLWSAPGYMITTPAKNQRSFAPYPVTYFSVKI